MINKKLLPMSKKFNLISCLFVALAFCFFPQKEIWACSFIPFTGISNTRVTIKIGATYFQIPEKYLYTHHAMPAERSHLILIIPHRDYVSLNKTGERGYNCEGEYDSRRTAISESVDFCGKNEEVYQELKYWASDIEPPSWKRDLELTNKFHLGINPCGGEAPLSWKTYTKQDILFMDIFQGLIHSNTQIKSAASGFLINYTFKAFSLKGLLISALSSIALVFFCLLFFKKMRFSYFS